VIALDIHCLLIVGLLLTLPAAAQRLDDTDQTTCYDVNAGMTMASRGALESGASGFEHHTRSEARAGEIERKGKVEATAPGRGYTKIANDGSPLPASAEPGSAPGDWGCTRDNATGLIWEVKATVGLRNQKHTYTWYDTNDGAAGAIGTAKNCGGTLIHCNTTAYRDAINALTGASRLCGATDWRLPTGKELSGLVQADLTSETGLDTNWFPNSVSSVYWTGESSTASTAIAWFVSSEGGIVVTGDKDVVQLVRGGH
jgi:hypothetical protein